MNSLARHQQAQPVADVLGVVRDVSELLDDLVPEEEGAWRHARLLLEEQAFPFEEQAISLHEINMRRSWDGVYDDWVKKSFGELARLMPGRFDKRELEMSYAQAIH